MPAVTNFKFYHGLGDCSNAAHLFALYTRRGIRIGVECAPDKAFLFEAAGCDVVPHANDQHDWVHAPPAGPPQHADHWSGNKTAWNISVPPLPDIGGYWDLWDDLCAVKLGLNAFVSPSVRRVVDDFIRDLPRPLVLFAPQGRTLTNQKNLTHQVQAQFLHAASGPDGWVGHSARLGPMCFQVAPLASSPPRGRLEALGARRASRPDPTI